MRDYTLLGQEIFSKEAIDHAIAKLTWTPYTKGQALPMAQGMVIQRLMNEYHIKEIFAVAVHGVIRPYEFHRRAQEVDVYPFIGLAARLGDGTQRRLYVADEGVSFCIVAVDEEA